MSGARTNFFRFPSTPHLAWLGQGTAPREDKILSHDEATAFLTEGVVVEEKIDGANVGISLTEDGELKVQNRGQYLVRPFVGQFSRMQEWLDLHESAIRKCLDQTLILFGEWSAARHSIGYDRLPDWFILFDVYDRKAARFWSTGRRDALATAAGLVSVPLLVHGETYQKKLEQLLVAAPSRYRSGPMEGLIVRRQTAEWCDCRAKLVRADFTQEIGEHWSRRRIEWNRVDWTNAGP